MTCSATSLPVSVCNLFIQYKGHPLLGPFVLTANLVLLFRCEVILDIEGLPNFLWRFALDHVGNSLASDIEKGFDIEVVGSLK